jgi:hypothetical protein
MGIVGVVDATGVGAGVGIVAVVDTPGVGVAPVVNVCVYARTVVGTVG